MHCIMVHCIGVLKLSCHFEITIKFDVGECERGVLIIGYVQIFSAMWL